MTLHKGFIFVLALTALSCNSILGLNDWEFDSEPTSGDTDTDTDSDTDSDTDTDTDTDGDHPCAGVTCYTPPQNECSGTSAIEIFDSMGYCVDGECRYNSHTEECVSGECSGRRCVSNPCQGVLCNEPPANECSGSNALMVYAPTGRCAGVVTPTCTYTSRSISCDGECSDNGCVGDPALGLSCTTPPARYCDGDTLMSYGARGRADGAECLYPQTRTECAGGCSEAQCIAEDPCLHTTCNSPPAAYCLEERILRTFPPVGTCNSGNCTYEPVDITCDGICALGQCQDDPCAGVQCLAPPPSHCLDEVSLFYWDGTPGTCLDGFCSYSTAVHDCPGECGEGYCLSGPCEAVLCLLPPPPSCFEDVHTDYSAIGQCVGLATCDYEPTQTTCDSGCLDNACAPSP